jgi:hypothetical protein
MSKQQKADADKQAMIDRAAKKAAAEAAGK